jgi:hypothetical protein
MRSISHMSFGQALVLFPFAVVLHVFEEWPRFPRSARRFASAAYSDREYCVTHTLAVVFAIGAVAVVRGFPTQPIVLFGFFAIVFGPAAFCNTLFHAGATILTRTYCPGVVSGVLVYVPLSGLFVVLGLRDGLFTSRFLMAAITIAAIVHALEVGHNVFKRW